MTHFLSCQDNAIKRHGNMKTSHSPTHSLTHSLTDLLRNAQLVIFGVLRAVLKGERLPSRAPQVIRRFARALFDPSLSLRLSSGPSFRLGLELSGGRGGGGSGGSRDGVGRGGGGGGTGYGAKSRKATTTTTRKRKWARTWGDTDVHTISLGDDATSQN